jgi:hypothetical protein
MYEDYQPIYYTFRTSVTVVTFTRCFSGVYYESTHRTIFGTAI